jgi:hypothetical protein
MRVSPVRIILAAVAVALGAPLAAQDIPAKLADSTFWRMVTEFSEPDGYFRSENLVGNEMSLQYVIPELKRTTKPGGVYLGVAPDQNFTYIVALRPKIAFIVDIRRGNFLEHMMYKALIEMSANRSQFLSLLFSKPLVPNLADSSSADALLNAYYNSTTSNALYQANLAAIKEHLTKKHGFALSQSDFAGLDYVYGAFYSAGPGLNYNFSTGGGGRGGTSMPTYWDMMVATDLQGAYHAYLATEATFKYLKDMETNNLIVPLVGNFAGDKSLRTVGKYLKDHNATVTAFYTSNVEQYLFQQGDEWARFFANVATLPLDATSTFIRSIPSNGRSAGPGFSLYLTLGSMAEHVKAFNEGRIRSYNDVIAMSHY